VAGPAGVSPLDLALVAPMRVTRRRVLYHAAAADGVTRRPAPTGRPTWVGIRIGTDQFDSPSVTVHELVGSQW
jgi:hypothetical protein